MEAFYVKVGGKRCKGAIRIVSTTTNWGTTHYLAFVTIKDQLAAVNLSHPRSEFGLCLFTDASNTHGSAILTQISKIQRKKKIEEKRHEPMYFLSGSFKGSSKNWSVPENEEFPIIESMCSVDYLVVGREFSIYTDQAILVHLHDPDGTNPGIPRHTASKLMQWAIKLRAFRYGIEHFLRDKNV